MTSPSDKLPHGILPPPAEHVDITIVARAWTEWTLRYAIYLCTAAHVREDHGGDQASYTIPCHVCTKQSQEFARAWHGN